MNILEYVHMITMRQLNENPRERGEWYALAVLADSIPVFLGRFHSP